MRQKLVYILALAFLVTTLFSVEASAHKRKVKAISKTPASLSENGGTSAAPSGKDRYKRGKRLKYVSPPDNITIDSIPLILPISDEAIDYLAKNKVDKAILSLRSDPPSARSIYILREAQKIQKAKREGAPKFGRHQFYQNLGIAYHNLFLLLKRHNITNKDFYKKALKYYGKAAKTDIDAEKIESELLIASLEAAGGEIEAGMKRFSQLDIEELQSTERGIEYIAAYYAAIGDTGVAMKYLIKGYELNPTQTVIWVAISDDFYNVENDPEFSNLTNEWKSAYKNKVEKKNLEKLKKSAQAKKKAAKSKRAKTPKKAIKKP